MADNNLMNNRKDNHVDNHIDAKRQYDCDCCDYYHVFGRYVHHSTKVDNSSSTRVKIVDHGEPLNIGVLKAMVGGDKLFEPTPNDQSFKILVIGHGDTGKTAFLNKVPKYSRIDHKLMPNFYGEQMGCAIVKTNNGTDKYNNEVYINGDINIMLTFHTVIFGMEYDKDKYDGVILFFDLNKEKTLTDLVIPDCDNLILIGSKKDLLADVPEWHSHIINDVVIENEIDGYFQLSLMGDDQATIMEPLEYMLRNLRNDDDLKLL